jgi:hypothetical protein
LSTPALAGFEAMIFQATARFSSWRLGRLEAMPLWQRRPPGADLV